MQRWKLTVKHHHQIHIQMWLGFEELYLSGISYIAQWTPIKSYLIFTPIVTIISITFLLELLHNDYIFTWTHKISPKLWWNNSFLTIDGSYAINWTILIWYLFLIGINLIETL